MANPQTTNALNNADLTRFTISSNPSLSQVAQTSALSIAPTFIQASGGPYSAASNTSAMNFTGTANATITNAYGYSDASNFAPSSSVPTLTITNAFGIYSLPTCAPGANGAVTNLYSLACDTPAGASNNYTAYFGSSNTAKVGIGTATPKTALSVVGGISFAVTSTTAAAYTVLSTDNTIEVNFAGAQITTLPAAAASNAGQIFLIKDVSGLAATNNITVKTAGGTIDGVAGATGIIIAVNYGFLKVFSDGTNYWIIDSFIASATGITWVAVAGTPQALAANTGYYVTNAAATTLTLPTTIAVGTVIAVTGTSTNTGGWTITQSAGQRIQYGNTLTTLGATGTLASSSIVGGDSVQLLCITANNIFQVLSSVGNLIVT